MFNTLSSKLEATFNRLRGRGRLTAQDIDEAMAEIRSALLEADVNYQLVKTFCENVRKKSVGAEVAKSLTPGQMVVKFVHDELVAAMGEHQPLNLKVAPPAIIMLVGLQGAGKTTTCGKLARLLKEDFRRRPLLCSVDVYRPAAIEQLRIVGQNLHVDVFPSDAGQPPLSIAKAAIEFAKLSGFDTVILDTAGRLQIDAELMDELIEIVEEVEPQEVLLVADAMTGQEAVNVAKGFDERLDVDGIILTKLDGDARGGAALSMRSVTKKPIKFIGVGEKAEALEVFHPERLVSRILGMGDVMTLIEKASKQVSVEDAKKLSSKLQKNDFSLEDFYQQLQTVKKMGSMTSLMQMVPGLGKMTKALDDQMVDKEMNHVEAIILSMTKAERQNHDLINGSRRKRIADGSGTSVEAVNRLLKQFTEMRKVMKKMTKLSPNMLRGLAGMGQFGGMRGGR